MRTYVFAIGGTGARVLKAFTMLLAAGSKGTSTNNEFVPIIIDYDIDNGDTNRTQDLLDTYESIHNLAYSSKANADQTAYESFFCSPVKKLKEISQNTRFEPKSRFEVFLKENKTNITFAQHIGVNTLTEENGTLETRQLLDVLYDNSPESSSTAELNLNLKVGFKGCPNIGCVVTKNLEGSLELQEFFNVLNPQDRIVIIGSIFGGTGASGIPMLLDLIRQRPNLNNVKVAVVAVTPYFKVTPDKSSAINSESFTAKTKAALEAYKLGNSVNKQANAIYYVGDNYQPGAFANFEGGREQKNQAHIVELVAGMFVLEFAGLPEDELPIGGDAKAFEFGYLPVDNNNLKEGEDPHLLGINRFYKDETLVPYIYPLCRFLIFCKFCEEYFLKVGEGERNDTWLRNTGLYKREEFKKLLDKFIKGFYQWIDELQDKNQKRGLSLFNPDKSYDELFRGIITSKKNYGIKTTYIGNKDIREGLSNRWVVATDKGKKALSCERPEIFFMETADSTVKGLFAEILDKNTK